MFTFALGLFAGHKFFLFIFNLFLLFAEGGRRNLEENVQKEKHWSQLLHVSGVHHVEFPHFPSFAAQFSSFPTENVFQDLDENLWTINRITEFPHFSLTLTISKIFRDFLKIPWLFLDLEKIFVFPWLFPGLENFSSFSDFSLTVATPSTVNSLYSIHLWDQYLVSVCQLRWGRLGERDLRYAKGQLTWKGEDPSTSKMLEGGSS